MKKILFIATFALALLSCKKEEITSISVNQQRIVAESGMRYQLSFSYTPVHLDKPTVQWTSSDSQVAEIIGASSNFCDILAKLNGTAIITCTEQSTGKKLSATCVVEVYNSAKFITDKITVEKGQSVNLSEYITGVVGDISWQTNNPSVCTVNGMTLYALNEGTCTISGHIYETGVDLSCQVEVTGILPTQIICDQTEMDLFFDAENDNNNIYSISYSLLPQGASAEVSMRSSNTNVAEVIEGTSFRIKNTGSTTLTLYTNNGVSQSIYVYVTNNITSVVESALSTPGSVIINGQMSGYGNIAVSISNHSKSCISIMEYGIYANNGYTTLSYHSYEEGGQTPPKVGIGQPNGETYVVVKISCSNINMTGCYGRVKYKYNDNEYTTICYYNPLGGL